MKTTIHNYSKATIKKMIRQELEKILAEKWSVKVK
jgi:hypothetical protein